MAFRVLNQDGSFNIVAKGLKKKPFSDLYYYLLAISWFQFFIFFVLSYLATNLVFATAFYLCGPSAFGGVQGDQPYLFFQECFFFSVQTLATIGYGHIHPLSLVANVWVTIEAFLGIFGLAILTGLIFARFAKPRAKILFSSKAIIGTFLNRPALLVRLANGRVNQILEAKVELILIRDESTDDGSFLRNVYYLPLRRDKTPVFNLSWTLVHYLDEVSPISNMLWEDFKKHNIEIMVSFTGIDEVLGQAIHGRSSYNADNIVFKHRFVDMTKVENGQVCIDLDKISHTVEC